MKKFNIGVAACALLLLGGCSSASNIKTVKVDRNNDQPVVIMPDQPNIIGSKPVGVTLKATAFKMSGDYANNVAVTVGSDGRLIFYPAPSDIRKSSAPMQIGDGWWLNRQGLSEGSVFTKWTFGEYAKLKSTPTQEEIKAAIIPGAVVTDFVQLPISASDAAGMKASELLYMIQK